MLITVLMVGEDNQSEIVRQEVPEDYFESLAVAPNE